MPIFNSFNAGSARKFGLSKGIVLNPPTNMATIVAETSVSVSFTAPSGDTPSNIEYRLSTNGGSTYGAFTALSPADFTSPIAISSLTSNEAYTAQLRTTLSGQFSDPSTSFNFQTLAAAPTGLSASSINDSSFVLSFSQATGGGETISNYKYALSTNGGSSYGAYTALSPADATSPVTISGLSSSTAYVVKIRAVTAAGDGTESGGLSVTTKSATVSMSSTLVSGGGGGGAFGSNMRGGGGGGAGKVDQPSFSVARGTYTVTIGGAGGSRGAGGATTVTNLYTGAGGSPGQEFTGNRGGTSGNGFLGGVNQNGGGAGGGGSSGAGNPNTLADTGGYGGAATTSTITGAAYGGGGGGGTAGNPNTGRTGGPAGAGLGCNQWGNIFTGGPANANSGSGGGGGSEHGAGGNGGSGIAIFRYVTADNAHLTITGGTVTTSGIYTIRTFTGTANLVVA